MRRSDPVGKSRFRMVGLRIPSRQPTQGSPTAGPGLGERHAAAADCFWSGVAGLLPMLRRRSPIAFNVFVDKLCRRLPMIPLAGRARSCHAANGSETLGLQGGDDPHDHPLRLACYLRAVAGGARSRWHRRLVRYWRRNQCSGTGCTRAPWHRSCRHPCNSLSAGERLIGSAITANRDA
jgi:hypothetical protein